MADLFALMADDDRYAGHHPFKEALVEVVELLWAKLQKSTGPVSSLGRSGRNQTDSLDRLLLPYGF